MLVRRSILTIGIVGVVAVGAGFFGGQLPAGFIPEEDQGIFGVNVHAAAGARRSSARAPCSAQVEEILGKTEGVESYQTIGGYGVVTSTYQPNFGTIFIRLKPWEERHGAELHVQGFMARIQAQVARIPEAIIFPFNIPTISGFGASAGFNFLLQDRSGSLSVERLGELSRQFPDAARKRPEIGNIFTSFDPRYPQVKVELDREKARKLGVPVNEAFQALASSLGGSYVNDFNRFGRLYRVYVQAEADYRRKPEDIGDIWVRSKTTNEMIPLVDARHHHRPGRAPSSRTASTCCARSRSAACRRRGYASGQALAALEAVFKETMPPEMGFTYSQLSYQEKTAPPAGPTFVAAIVFVFLLLAALYESWRLPWAVLLGSPLVVLGAFFGVWLARLRQQRLRPDRQHHADRPRRQERDPDRRVREGQARRRAWRSQEAALESARLRFRPDPDDRLRLHPGRRPADAGERRRRRRPERHGHGGLLRHAGRHRARRLPDPGQLRLRRARWAARRSAPRPRRRRPCPRRPTGEGTEHGPPHSLAARCLGPAPPSGCALGPELRAAGRAHAAHLARDPGGRGRRASPTRRGGSCSTTRSSRS